MSWEPQPGIVACEFLDCENRKHTIVDKIPTFTTLDLDERGPYPVAGVVQCKVLDRFQDSRGRELVRIRTHGIESTDGVSEFIVLPSQLSEAQ